MQNKKRNIKNVTVSFNELDPDQFEMWKYVNGKTNSSAYLKRLVQRDMEGTTKQIELPPTDYVATDVAATSESTEAFNPTTTPNRPNAPNTTATTKIEKIEHEMLAGVI